MRLKKNATTQKIRGAYYTPRKLTDFMIKLFAEDTTIKNILEPSCGDGAFIESIIEHLDMNKINMVKAVEIVSEEADKVEKKTVEYDNINIINDDFIVLYEKIKNDQQFDLIVGNPPYVRYQYLSEEQRELQNNILKSNGMKANKLINVWVSFLVSCVHLLRENGKIAFVLPAELLQVVYAEDLRLYLSNHLSKITLITFEELVFDDIEQEVVVFIGEKASENKDGIIGIKQCKNFEDLNSLKLNEIQYKHINHVKEKWTKYFTNELELGIIEKIKDHENFLRFDEIALINVGITTGDNKYFSVEQGIINEYDLHDVVIPLIGRSAHARGIYFTEVDWKYNIGKNKKANLLSFPLINEDEYKEGHKQYILLGEEKDVHKGYKCSIRDKWYVVPSIWVPDAFFLRRNDTYPKFVLNECNAVSTDTMHRIKFNDGIEHPKALLSYYNSVSFAFTEICGRSYGGGVLEILPREVGNIILPDLSNFSAERTKLLLELIDNVVRNGESIEIALDIIDDEVLVGHIGLSKKMCNEFRVIWKKLMERRKGRGNKN